MTSQVGSIQCLAISPPYPKRVKGRCRISEFSARWGVTVISVEIKDVVISEELEDAIAREPAAERDKRARIQLAEAEKLAVTAFVEAGKQYEDNPIALQLRSMNMLYEMCMEGKSTMVFVPTERASGAMPGVIGIESIEKLLKGKDQPQTPDT